MLALGSLDNGGMMEVDDHEKPSASAAVMTAAAATT
jgi:hypothetical protein